MKHILQIKIHAKIYEQKICEKNLQTIRIYSDSVVTSVDVWMDKNLGKLQKCKNNPYTDTTGDTKQSRLESTTEITQNKHVKVLHYFVDDIK